MNFESGTLFTIAVVYVGMILAAVWLAMVIWTYRDMRARSRDMLAQWLVAFIVALLNFPGLLIYIFLRPRETLAESYERSLEEEALLQEIEEKPACPGCGQRVQESWQACPHCHTRLKKNCISCRQLLELSWNLCPHCATSQRGHVEPPPIEYEQPRPSVSLKRQDPMMNTTESLEFIDDEY